jgi:hypothetical protein
MHALATAGKIAQSGKRVEKHTKMRNCHASRASIFGLPDWMAAGAENDEGYPLVCNSMKCDATGRISSYFW